MRSHRIISYLLVSVLCAFSSGIEVPKYLEEGAVSYHDFQGTPFLNSEEFHNTIIGGSTNITFQQINKINNLIRPALETLVHEPFFRIFKLNLYKSCPFWEQDGFCLYRSCAVDTINDWTELPAIWQPEELGKLHSTPEMNEKNKRSLEGFSSDENECIDEISNNNYCRLDGADEDCVYVDLVQNPERFTGYGGEQSFQIWKLIYDENCFHNNNGNSIALDDSEEQCVEKQIFYRLISGMHSSISTHLTNDYLDLKTKEYGPNLLQFMFKVGNFPERFENMYLNYILVVKSLIKLYRSNYLDSIVLCSPEFASQELELRNELKSIVKPFLSLADGQDEILFNEKELFQAPNAIDLKNDFKMRFRNVSSIMDCVHCDRCRVWGKLQTTGYGTALKILFELDESNNGNENFSLEKIELIALINTFDRLSKSIASALNFESLFKEAYEKEESGSLSVEEEEKNTFENILAASSSANSDKDDFKISKKTKKSLQSFSEPEIIESEELKDKKNEQRKSQTLKEAFNEELYNTWQALIFIWESYFALPKTVFDFVTLTFNRYWMKFIGVEQPINMNADSYLQTLFDRSNTV